MTLADELVYISDLWILFFDTCNFIDGAAVAQEGVAGRIVIGRSLVWIPAPHSCMLCVLEQDTEPQVDSLSTKLS